jgi:hypothetical protein
MITTSTFAVAFVVVYLVKAPEHCEYHARESFTVWISTSMEFPRLRHM